MDRDKLSFESLTEMFSNYNNSNKLTEGADKKPLDAYIVFTEDSFDTDFDEFSRTYKISSDAKFFRSECLSNSLFGDCVDGTDDNVRLDWYIKDVEHPWKIEYCYLK